LNSYNDVVRLKRLWNCVLIGVKKEDQVIILFD
jgi:hypothetical protein